MTLYRVGPKLPYRGHQPGTYFEATLPPGPETRALDRGAIRVVNRSTPKLQPGSYRLPAGWPTKQEEG